MQDDFFATAENLGDTEKPLWRSHSVLLFPGFSFTDGWLWGTTSSPSSFSSSESLRTRVWLLLESALPESPTVAGGVALREPVSAVTNENVVWACQAGVGGAVPGLGRARLSAAFSSAPTPRCSQAAALAPRSSRRSSTAG